MSDTRTTTAAVRTPSKEASPAWLELVREQVASLKFGTILITVHDSRIVQVEKSEKVRLDPTTPTT